MVYRRFLEVIAAAVSTIGVVNRVLGKQDSWSPYGQGLKHLNSNLDSISESLDCFYKHSSTFTTKEVIHILRYQCKGLDYQSFKEYIIILEGYNASDSDSDESKGDLQ